MFAPSRFRRFWSICTLLAVSAAAASAGEVAYENDFEKADLGKAPAEFTIFAGAFKVAAEGGNKFFELPGDPVDAYGFLFGPGAPGDALASARIFGTKLGRRFPAFGLSLCGAGGYRLQVSPGKKALEIIKGDESKVSVPYDWTSGVWTHLVLKVHKAGAGWVAEGKAWAEGSPEPADWLIKFEDPEETKPGRAGVWGTPFSGTPIRFDDLRLENLP